MVANKADSDSSQRSFHYYEWIKISVSLAAAAAVLIAYLWEVEQRKIDRTMDLASIYLTGEVMGAHQHMKGMLMNVDVPVRELIDAKIGTEEFGDGLEDVALAFARENPKHVYTLSEFFFELARCVEVERCDEVTACKLFGDRIDNFVFAFEQPIKEWEDSYAIEPRVATLLALVNSKACDDNVRGASE